MTWVESGFYSIQMGLALATNKFPDLPINLAWRVSKLNDVKVLDSIGGYIMFR